MFTYFLSTRLGTSKISLTFCFEQCLLTFYKRHVLVRKYVYFKCRKVSDSRH